MYIIYHYTLFFHTVRMVYFSSIKMMKISKALSEIYYNPWSRGEFSSVDNLLAAFTKVHPNIKISLKIVTDFLSKHRFDKVITSIAKKAVATDMLRGTDPREAIRYNAEKAAENMRYNAAQELQSLKWKRLSLKRRRLSFVTSKKSKPGYSEPKYKKYDSVEVCSKSFKSINPKLFRKRKLFAVAVHNNIQCFYCSNRLENLM